MMPLPRESWIVLAATGGGLALVQTMRLWWRVASVRWRLRDQSERAAAGEVRAEKLLRRAGYRVDARQATQRWAVRVDGEPHEVTLRADFIVTRRGRRYVAEVKTGADAPEIAAPATRRQLLEYRCAFAADGLLLVDAESNTIHTIDFALPTPPSSLRAVLIALIAGALLTAAFLTLVAP